MKLTKESFKQDYKNKLTNLFAEDLKTSSNLHKYIALGSLIKDYVSKNWLNTNKKYYDNKMIQVYYFSMEFLIGKLLVSNLLNLGILNVVEEALSDLGLNLGTLEDQEQDAGLGNGGLGRLAACFLDSMASLKIPGHGCGIRYNYGLFEQKIINGYQVEIPDNWLKDGNIWEIRKDNESEEVKYGGYISTYYEDDVLKFSHENYENIIAVPYDTPIIGYDNSTVNTLRLWSAEPANYDFDFSEFSHGEYSKAVEYKSNVESICQVLYPDDSTYKGKLLRLKQQYFFVSASTQSIIKKHLHEGAVINKIDEYIRIHINDTHPSMVIAEFMRILIDNYNLSWEESFRITTNVMSYTNHTILSEALEKWPIDMFKNLLPRLYMIIEEIDRRFCIEISKKYPNDNSKIESMRIIQDGVIRMAYLAIVGSHSVNGVAKLHTEILKNQELKDFYSFYPNKFNNKTNGITHRRWLLAANKPLTNLISETIGDGFIKRPTELKKLMSFSKDSAFQKKIDDVKQNNKIMFSNYVKEQYNVSIDPLSIFDVQVKRLHAYKRQILNVFNIIDLYNRLLDNPDLDIVPRTFLFGAKASPSYFLAKETIKLINTVADKINNDTRIKDKIKVLFLENYRVSLAEKVILGADVSEQISTTTKEASGTGNMKFMMNGAVTIATLDGANVEIFEAVGNENIFLFGMKDYEVLNFYKNGGYNSSEYYHNDPRLFKIINQISNGFFNVPTGEFKLIYDSLIYKNDEYFVLKDFDSYVNAQNKVDEIYRNRAQWSEMAIVNIANSGMFSSDNTIKEYAREIWNINKFSNI